MREFDCCANWRANGGQLSAPDLVRRTGLAKASVARGLDSLVASDIVDVAGTGRSLLYRLASGHPLTPALAGLFETEERRFQCILDSIKSAAKSVEQGRLAALWLYGSVARAEGRAGSDVDLALVAAPDALPGLADALRDALIAPAESLAFTPSLVALETGDIVRLAAQRDPWWVRVAGDVLPLTGTRPEDRVATVRGGADGKMAA